MAAAVAFRPAGAVTVPYGHGAPGGYAGPYNCDVRPMTQRRGSRGHLDIIDVHACCVPPFGLDRSQSFV